MTAHRLGLRRELLEQMNQSATSDTPDGSSSRAATIAPERSPAPAAHTLPESFRSRQTEPDPPPSSSGSNSRPTLPASASASAAAAVPASTSWNAAEPKKPPRHHIEPKYRQHFTRSSGKTKALMNATDKINQENGEWKQSFSLPEIVVVGDQSDGKSTLLEAISGVQLPKGSGVCTKCPIRLCIREADKEEASITHPNSASPQVLKSLAELEPGLRAAQEALLGNDGSLITNKTITVHVKGPNLPNITIVDLPGINRKSDEMEAETVSLIETWIRKEETIIVVVVKATNDIDLSKGLQIATVEDPDGRRTVIVLTNCDGTVANKEDEMKEFLRKRDGLIFTVNCFREEGSSATREDIFKKEKEFFSAHPVFQEHRLAGTPKLIGYLEDLLCEKISPHAEKILAYAKQTKRTLKQELSEMKKVKENMEDVMGELLYKIRKESEEHLTGSHRHQPNSLFHKCRQIWTEFGEKIRSISADLKKNLREKIKEESREQQGRELDQLINNFPVMQRIIAQLIDDFSSTAKEAFDYTQARVRAAIISIVRDELDRTKQLRNIPEVESYLTTYMTERMEEVEEKARLRIQETLSMQKIAFLNNPSIEEFISTKFDELPRDLDLARMQEELAPGEDPGTDVGSSLGGKLFALLTDVSKSLSAEGPGSLMQVAKSTVSLLPVLAEKHSIPLFLAKAALTYLQFRNAQSGGSGNATMDDCKFHRWDDENRLFCLTDVCIDVVRDRVADALPMAIMHFFNHRLADRVYLLFPKLSKDDVDKLLDGSNVQAKIEALETKLHTWTAIVESLNSMQ